MITFPHSLKKPHSKKYWKWQIAWTKSPTNEMNRKLILSLERIQWLPLMVKCMGNQRITKTRLKHYGSKSMKNIEKSYVCRVKQLVFDFIGWMVGKILFTRALLSNMAIISKNSQNHLRFSLVKWRMNKSKHILIPENHCKALFGNALEMLFIEKWPKLITIICVI